MLINPNKGTVKAPINIISLDGVFYGIVFIPNSVWLIEGIIWTRTLFLISDKHIEMNDYLFIICEVATSILLLISI